ncbi:MAG: Hpt domain-containing protein [Coxiella-like endosymbiont]|nr:Hpt domain-containing protein [Coxiella-like endosymbiont]
MKNQVHKLHGSCHYMSIFDLKNLAHQLEKSVAIKKPS